ncbi:MAG: hypothetical protein ACYSSP_02550 [Planctomycetota bacterium]
MSELVILSMVNLRALGSGIGIVFLIWLSAEVLGSINLIKPPLSVRFAGWIEMAFGSILFLPSIVFLLIPFEKGGHLGFILLLSLCFVGFGWITLTVYLLKGSLKARKIFILLSVIRMLTIVGIPFSLLSIYLLYYTNQARTFFENKRGEQEITDS